MYFINTTLYFTEILYYINLIEEVKKLRILKTNFKYLKGIFKKKKLKSSTVIILYIHI